MSLPDRIVAVLRAASTLRAARELFAAHPSSDVLVVVGAGVEAPDTLGATAPAGRGLAAVCSLAVALDVAAARSAEAARDLAAPPPLDAVRVLYLDTARGCAVASAPDLIVGRRSAYAAPKGAA